MTFENPETVGFGVLGGNSFVANAAVIPAIKASRVAELVAVGSRGESTNYDDVLADPGVDVVYIALPNGLHAKWTAKAAAAGKHVLCEKPLAPRASEAAEMIAACTDARVRLFEAWMTPFSPPWADAVSAARAARVTHIASRFTFTIGPGNETNYRWDPTQGGGALLDVGIYALGPAVELWGSNPEVVTTTAEETASGVDLTTTCTLTWADGQICDVIVSFGLPEAQELRLTGPAFDRTLTGNVHTGVDGTYTRMIDAVCDDLTGQVPFPRAIEDAVAMLRLIERIQSTRGFNQDD